MLARKRKTAASKSKSVRDADKNLHPEQQDDEKQGVLVEKQVQRMRQLSHQPQKAAVVDIILDTVFDAIEQYPVEQLPQPPASGTQMLVKLLSETEAGRVKQAQEDPLQAARLRGIAARERLLNAEGGSLSVSQVEKMLGISRQAIHKRCSKGKLIALSTSKRGYLFPSWQFTANGILPGLEQVLVALDENDPWMQASFMLNPNIWLDGISPLEMLRQGKIEQAIAAARASGEQGAA